MITEQTFIDLLIEKWPAVGGVGYVDKPDFKSGNKETQITSVDFCVIGIGQNYPIANQSHIGMLDPIWSNELDIMVGGFTDEIAKGRMRLIKTIIHDNPIANVIVYLTGYRREPTGLAHLEDIVVEGEGEEEDDVTESDAFLYEMTYILRGDLETDVE